MKDIREMFNISYFDNKELSLKEHCDIYSNIRKDLISILNKYDIKYVVTDTESIRDLSSENKKLKKQLEEYQKELEKADSITQSCIFNGKEESKISYRKCLNILDKKETQQKEFIKYLEKTIVDSKAGRGQQYYFQEILSKYKSIIGGKE